MLTFTEIKDFFNTCAALSGYGKVYLETIEPPASINIRGVKSIEKTGNPADCEIWVIPVLSGAPYVRVKEGDTLVSR